MELEHVRPILTLLRREKGYDIRPVCIPYCLLCVCLWCLGQFCVAGNRLGTLAMCLVFLAGVKAFKFMLGVDQQSTLLPFTGLSTATATH